MMAKRDYQLVSAPAHLGLPPGFFQRYLPENYRDHDWVRMVEAGTKQSLKMAGMGLGHMAGKRYEDFKEKDITEGDIRVGEFEPTARLKDMDLDGVDAEVLISGGAVPAGEGIDVDFQRAVIQSYNNFLSEFCQADLERLIGPATVPLGNQELALEEMKRASKLPGIRAFLFDAFPAVNYWDEMYEPFCRWPTTSGTRFISTSAHRRTRLTMGSLAPNEQARRQLHPLSPLGWPRRWPSSCSGVSSGTRTSSSCSRRPGCPGSSTTGPGR